MATRKEALANANKAESAFIQSKLDYVYAAMSEVAKDAEHAEVEFLAAINDFYLRTKDLFGD